MTHEPMADFPKLYCPYIRQTFPVNKDRFREKGARFGLRAPEVYLAVDQVNPGYEWVFDDPDTFAVEKLNGSNVKIKTEKGRLTALQNRKNIIDPLQILHGKTFIIEGIFRSVGKGYIQENGEQAGELIGPKVNANPYKLDFHEWYPFDKAVKDLRYKSFHDHDRTFANWSAWFKDWLHSRYYAKKKPYGQSQTDSKDKVFAEGVVFYNLKRQNEGKTWRAKLRRDMFDWYYEGFDIQGYTPAGRTQSEDQEQFD